MIFGRCPIRNSTAWVVSETMNRLVRDGDGRGAIVIWDGLDQHEQRLIWFGLVSLVNHLRAERGDDQDVTYDCETVGL